MQSPSHHDGSQMGLGKGQGEELMEDLGTLLVGEADGCDLMSEERGDGEGTGRGQLVKVWILSRNIWLGVAGPVTLPL